MADLRNGKEFEIFKQWLMTLIQGAGFREVEIEPPFTYTATSVGQIAALNISATFDPSTQIEGFEDRLKESLEGKGLFDVEFHLTGTNTLNITAGFDSIPYSPKK